LPGAVPGERLAVPVEADPGDLSAALPALTSWRQAADATQVGSGNE
jgi:hypothetical protein